MKTRLLILMFFFMFYGFSQTVNDYKAVIIPLKYDFQKSENQYRLQTITKLNLQKSGFQAFYTSETSSSELNDRCSLLYVNVIKDDTFLISKLYITFKDCYGTLVFQSSIGKSKEKEFQDAYIEALNNAFESVYALNYKYNGNTNTVIKEIPQAVPEIVPLVVTSPEPTKEEYAEFIWPKLLYAQPTSYGYQLVDSEPKLVMKIYKTSNPDCYIATRGGIQGVLVSKDNQWFFEYYKNNQLISDKNEVKF